MYDAIDMQPCNGIPDPANLTLLNGENQHPGAEAHLLMAKYLWNSTLYCENIAPPVSAPVAAFSANATNICVGDTVQFTDSSSLSPTSWSWVFGDGNTSILQSPLHKYNFAGRFGVSLKVSNSKGFDWENKSGYINASTCAVPTPTPTPPSPTGCVFINITGANIEAGSQDWTVTSGNTTWGTTITNLSAGKISFYRCGPGTL
jgi:PKD repeat protein